VVLFWGARVSSRQANGHRSEDAWTIKVMKIEEAAAQAANNSPTPADPKEERGLRVPSLTLIDGTKLFYRTSPEV
jgi:hypothetical protein